MKPTKGENLSPEQIKHVKSAYGYRWTIQNENRARNWLGESAPTIALIDDEQWTKEHAFYFRKDGKPSRKHNHCVPAYMAD